MQVHTPSPSSRFNLITLALACAALALGWLVVSAPLTPLLNTTYTLLWAARHATHLRMVEQISTAWPLTPFILMLPAKSTLAAPTLALIVGALFGGSGAWLLARLLRTWWAGLAYLIVCFSTPDLAPMLAVVLALGGLTLLLGQRWLWAGVLLGLACLAEPAAAWLALILAPIVILRLVGTWSAVRRYLAPVILLIAVWLVPTIVRDIQVINIYTPVLLPALSVMALVGLVVGYRQLSNQPSATTLITWAALVLALAFSRGSLPSLIIAPGLIAAGASLTANSWRRWLPIVVTIAAVLDAVFLTQAIVRPTLPAEMGAWLNANTGAEAVIAQPASIAGLISMADRRIVDTSGTWQAASLQDPNFFTHYAPDVVILRDDEVPAWEHFATTYAKVHTADGWTAYQRVVDFAPWTDHTVQFSYGVNGLDRQDLRLVNVAIADAVKPGQFVRIRLDWVIAYPLPKKSGEVRVNLLNTSGIPVAGNTLRLNDNALNVPMFSTYHLLILPADVPAGPLTVYVGVDIQAGRAGEYAVLGTTVQP